MAITTVGAAALMCCVFGPVGPGASAQAPSAMPNTLPWAYSCLLPLWSDLPGPALWITLRVIPGDDRATEWVVWLRRRPRPSQEVEALIREPDGYRVAVRWLSYPQAAAPPGCDLVRRDLPVRECRVGAKEYPVLSTLIEEFEAIGLPVPGPRQTVAGGTRYDITVDGEAGTAELRTYGPANPNEPVGREWDPVVRWANSLYRLLRNACRPPSGKGP